MNTPGLSTLANCASRSVSQALVCSIEGSSEVDSAEVGEKERISWSAHPSEDGAQRTMNLSVARRFVAGMVWKHLPLKDVAEAGGWHDIETLLTCYQHPDRDSLLKVMTDERPVREDAVIRV